MYEGYSSINDGLEATRSILNDVGDKIYYDLTAKFQTEGDSAKADFELGMKIRDTSARLISYINEMKVLLIAKCEDKKRSEVEAQDTIISLKYLKNYDDYTTPSKILVGDDFWAPKRGEFTAYELEEKVSGYMSLMDTVWDDADYVSNNHLAYMYNFNWKRAYIKDMPLASVITTLSKLQLDIKLQEQSAIRYLIRK